MIRILPQAGIGILVSTTPPALKALQAEVDALKRLQTDTATELNALPPALLDRALKGELRNALPSS